MTDAHSNPYALLDTDLPTDVSLSIRMADLERRARLIEGLRNEISAHEATIRDAQACRDIATRRLTVAMHSADLLRDIEYAITPLLGLADRAAPADPAPAPDGPATLIDTPAPVTDTPEPEPVLAQVAELSEPDVQPTLDLVFPAGFELGNQARTYLDIGAHPGATLSDILERTGLARGSVSGVLTKGVSGLRLSRVGAPSQYTLTDSGVSYLRQLQAYAMNQAAQEQEEPEPESAPAPVRKVEPVQPAEPAAGSAQARALDFLREYGPTTPQGLAAHLGMPRLPTGAVISQLVKHGYATQTDTDPRLILIPGDTRLPAKPAQQTAAAGRETDSGTNLISQEELKARVRENAQAVRAVLSQKPLTEQDLRARLPDLQLSHLRAALGYLEEAGTVRRVPGPTPASRAAYALDALELPAPTLDHLTAEGRMVEAHLAQVTDRSERDTASNMALKLGLPREQIEEALSVLHAQGRLRWSRTGMLVHYSLTTAGEVAA